MPIPLHRFGQTTIAKVRNSDELKQVLVDPLLESETIIVKPNWVSWEPAGFTDTEALRALFEALDSRIVVTESHMLARAHLEEGLTFTIGEKEVDWLWLWRGEGWRWLREKPDWDWFTEGGHWDQIRKEDKAFLDDQGFTDLFEEFDVEYVNVTEEVWSGRIADPAKVKRSVESRFKPVREDKLYNMVPKKLYDLRGSTFISFAKLKRYATFSLKNLFGLIPDPLRPWWHGPKNSRLAESIVDVNKVYHSLFDVYGICEAMKTMGVLHPEGEFQSLFSNRPRFNIVEDLRFVAFGRDLVSLDAITCNLAGFDLRAFAAHIDMAEEEGLGAYDLVAIEESKTKVGDWLTG